MTVTRGRWLTVGLVLVLLVAGVITWRVRVAGEADRPTLVQGRPEDPTCGHYRSDGDRLGDAPLLSRALDAWIARLARDRRGGPEDDVSGIPELQATVCVVDAEARGSAVHVTLVSNTRHAVYTESPGGGPGRIEVSDEAAGATSLAVVVGDGRVALSDRISSASVHTPTPSGTATVMPLREGVHVLSLDPGIRPAESPLLYAPVLVAVNGRSTSVVTAPDVGWPQGVLSSTVATDPDDRPALDTALARPFAVPMLRRGIIDTLDQRPQDLETYATYATYATIIGQATVPGGSQVMVVQRQPGVGGRPSTIDVVQSPGTAEDAQWLGAIATHDTFRTNPDGWIAGTTLRARPGGQDPHVYLVTGTGASDDRSPISLTVRIVDKSVTVTGPLAVLTPAQLPGVATITKQTVVGLFGRTAKGAVVPELGTS